MKKIFKTSFLIASSMLVTSTITPLVSCNPKPEPEKKGVQIFEPLQKTVTAQITDYYAIIQFNGFQYDYDKSTVFDIDKLDVKMHVDPEGSGEWTPKIDRQDILNKTFSIRIQYTSAGEQALSVSCTFEFLYDNKPIEDFVSSKYTINFFHDASIVIPSERHSETRLDGSGNGTIVYTGFKFDDQSEIDDINAYSVNNTFAQASGTSFVSTIDNFDEDEKTFDVKIEISGALPVDLLDGKLSFKYGELDVPVSSKDTSFTMRLKDIIDITKPTGELATAEGFVDDDQDKVTLIFKRFECSGIDDPVEEIQVFNQGFEDTKISDWNITYRPINWSLASKSFDIQVDITGVEDVKDFDCLKGDFTFKVNGEDLPTEQSEFIGVVKYSIPETDLTITLDESKVLSLSGIRPGADLSNYNSLSIPINVSIIAKNAFYDSTTSSSTLSENIKYLDFPTYGALEEIGASAFEKAPFIQKDINFPQSLKKIGENAFSDCTNLTGCISFPYTIFKDKTMNVYSNAFSNCSSIEKVIISQPVNLIGSQVFEGCKKIKVLDFSHTYKWDTIPSWLINCNFPMFEGVGTDVCTVEDKGQVLLHTKTPQSLVAEWITQLSKIKLDISTDPQTSKWACKIMPE